MATCCQKDNCNGDSLITSTVQSGIYFTSNLTFTSTPSNHINSTSLYINMTPNITNHTTYNYTSSSLFHFSNSTNYSNNITLTHSNYTNNSLTDITTTSNYTNSTYIYTFVPSTTSIRTNKTT